MNNSTLDSATLDGLSGGIGNSFGDLACSIVTSDYKWLSKTLKAEQQKFAVRPYYTAQIIDDSLIPNQILTSPLQPLQGSAVRAPDGNILAVGLDTSNNVGFWKISDGSNSSLWSAAPTAILENNAHNRNLKNHYAIQVSDYISGTYAIDIYFFGNFDGSSGSNIKIIHYRSTDGGISWFATPTVADTNIPFGSVSSTNLSIASGKPYQDNLNNLIGTVFYLNINGLLYDIYYAQYSGTGSTYGTPVAWSSKDVNTKDWVLHSLDVSYIKNTWYVTFSGYHTFYDSVNQNPNVQNFGVYLTKIVNFQNDSTKDIWSIATPIITAVSSSTQNLNSFTLPQLTYNASTKILFVIFNGAVVTSVVNNNGSQNVLTTTNYYLAQSKDFLNFTYPNPIIMGNGTQFTDTYSYSFVFQGQYAYLAGNGQLWQFIQNNIVADVSSDILSYTISETQQSTTTLALSVGNANNKWYGGNPSTGLGNAAIAKNKKINIFQGYYTNNQSTQEVAPKNIFYIDDIQQGITTSKNDLSFACRDLYKLLSVLQTKFAYNFSGIRRYLDIFDGTTTSNYNFLSGSWSEENNELVQGDSTSPLAVALFSNYQQVKSNTIFTISAQLPNPSLTGSSIFLYAYYVDANNYIALEINNNGSGTSYNWGIEQTVGGSTTTLSSGSFPTGTTNFFPFMFIRESYYKIQVFIGSDAADGLDINAFNTGSALGSEVDFTGIFSLLGNVAFATLNTNSAFANFRYNEFDASQNIEELIQSIATKSGIFDYKLPTLFQDYFYNDSDYTGTHTLQNRSMVLGASSFVMKNDQQFDNIEVDFEAQIAPLSSASPFYFDFFFRSSSFTSATNSYFLRFQQSPTGYVSVVLYNNSGTSFQMGGTSLFGSTNNNLRFDLTQFHKYRIIFFNQFFYVLIDNQIVFSWIENNTTINWTTGYIGFGTSSNTQGAIKNIVGVDLWNQIEAFSVNPGDDLENSIETLIATVRVYFFSDNFGRMKVVRLNSTDTSTYTYQNQMILQGVDNSDKEYINQVTVVGSGVTATVRDARSISSSGVIREEVINDNKITSYSDAVARGQAELINYNKFNNQYNPKQVLNAGSELYDAVHVINTGANSSNVDTVVRVYSQETDVGGDNISYWLQVQTGLL